MTKDFIAGEVILIDKDVDWTSFDVVNKVRNTLRKLLDIKKIKVGHAGTLDPLATGLLILCSGKMTKQIDSFQGMDKVYTGTIRLGVTTPSFDLETEVTSQSPYEHISMAEIKKAASEFEGEILQEAPIYSALKFKGQPMYKLARKNKEVVPKTRNVIINRFEILSQEGSDLQFELHCGKGTYVRSIANDIGKKLGCGATLASLRRTKIGDFDVSNASTVKDWVASLEQEK